MLNRPKYMTPSTNVSECTIDMNADEVIFSCIVDGNESIKSWQIRVYRLKDNILVYDSGKITLDEPFYPIDEKNRNVVFSVNIKNYPTETKDLTEDENWTEDNPSYITLQNSKDVYYWTIDFCADSGYTVHSAEEVFYANSNPTTEIFYSKNNSDFQPFVSGTALDTKEYFFKATYTQAENIGLKKFGWRLKDKNNNRVLIDTITKNQIYGVSDNIKFSYDGFLGSTDYALELYVETQNNVYVITKPIEFSVEYSTTLVTNNFDVQALKNEPSIMLNWSNTIAVGGIKNGDIEILKDYPVNGKNSVNISKSSSISFDYGTVSDLNIPQDSIIVLSTQLLDDVSQDIFVAEGYDDNEDTINIKLKYADSNSENGARFVYTFSTSTGLIRYTAFDLIKPANRYVWYVIKLYPLDGEYNGHPIEVDEFCAIGGLMPSSAKYPSTNLYPSLGTWQKVGEN